MIFRILMYVPKHLKNRKAGVFLITFVTIETKSFLLGKKFNLVGCGSFWLYLTEKEMLQKFY